MSNETKFTPGPWIVTEAHDEVSVAMGDAVDSPYEYTCGHLWQTVDVYWSEADEEDIANAHLIAAAPEMYAALESTNRELEMVINELNELKRQNICCTDLDPPDYHDQQAIHENMVLLARARGEKP